jgi:hypothetical protein
MKISARLILPALSVPMLNSLAAIALLGEMQWHLMGLLGADLPPFELTLLRAMRS